jgi:hypothetical protein
VVFVRKINDKPHLRFCPMPRIWRSFAVLRRSSLATLAQRLRQAQDDKSLGGGESAISARLRRLPSKNLLHVRTRRARTSFSDLKNENQLFTWPRHK